MEIVILAGGLGTRLRSSIGEAIPKCMAPIGGKPFLWYLLTYLKRFPISKVVLSVGHLRDVIIEWIDKNRDEFPFSFDFSIEKEPMGTGGGIKLALDKCKVANVIVLNGDTFFDIDLNSLLESHKLYPSTVSLALKPMNNFDRYGRVLVNIVEHRIHEFCEKQPCKTGFINGGVYCINRINIQWPEESKFSFEKDVLERTVSNGMIFGFEFNDYFIDIGIPEDFEKANLDLKTLFNENAKSSS